MHFDLIRWSYLSAAQIGIVCVEIDYKSVTTRLPSSLLPNDCNSSYKFFLSLKFLIPKASKSLLSIVGKSHPCTSCSVNVDVKIVEYLLYLPFSMVQIYRTILATSQFYH